MTKGQRRAGTQTLHISSSPISQCTFQDLLGRGEGEWGGGAGVQEEKEDRERETERKRKRERELSTSSTLHRGIAFLLLAGEWQKEKQVTKR